MSVLDKWLMPSRRHSLGGRWIRLLVACLMVPLLTSCAGSGRVIDTGCLWTREIRVSQADVLTNRTAQEILAHNRERVRRCGRGHGKPHQIPL